MKKITISLFLILAISSNVYSWDCIKFTGSSNDAAVSNTPTGVYRYTTNQQTGEITNVEYLTYAPRLKAIYKSWGANANQSSWTVISSTGDDPSAYDNAVNWIPMSFTTPLPPQPQGGCCVAPQVWSMQENKCITPCPSGEIRLLDPVRCECQPPTVRKNDGTCGQPDDCENAAQQCVDNCGGDAREIEVMNCEVEGGVFTVNECQCKAHDCEGDLVWSIEKQACDAPDCGENKEFNWGTQKCQWLPCEDTSQVRDKETGICAEPEEPEEKGCPEGFTEDENGDCIENPETPCPEGQTRNEMGKCEGPPADGCPEGETRNDQGDCVANKPDEGDCPEGYYKAVTGLCVQETAPCPEGQTRNQNGSCSTPEGTDKKGKVGYWKDKLPAKPVPVVKAWGVPADTKVDWQPVMQATNSFKNSDFVRGVGNVKTIVQQFVAPGNAPEFNFPMWGGNNINIDMSIFDPLAAMVRGMISLLMYCGTIWLVIKQWRLL